MTQIRDVRLLIRDRQVDGGAIPGSALMGEPFVNLYNGVLRFSGVTGGDFETSSQSGIFEVGSRLYNQRIENRLNINDNFIISGGTGLISTYGGSSGAGIDGKFLSGTTSGFVLGDISDIVGVQTRVQPGVNIITGGTADNPTVNLVDSPSINNLTLSGTATGGNASFVDMSATTIYSGGTDLYGIFLTAADVSASTVSAGSNVSVSSVGLDYEVSIVDSPSFNDITFSGTATGGNASFVDMSATTLYSGSTDLDTVIRDIATGSEDITRVQPGANTTTGGTDNFPVVNVVDSPVFAGLVSATGFTDSSLTAGRVVYVGASGRLVDEAGFTYEDTSNTLSVRNIQIGDPSTTGDNTATIYGNVVIVGDAFSAQTSELYIEDNLIELNFNPTASTESTSLGAGFSVQDGSGLAGTDVFFDIRGAGTGVLNRGFATNMNDIYIRESGSISSPNGNRVLAETDCLDGGTY
jgi:hypothetical protein